MLELYLINNKDIAQFLLTGLSNIQRLQIIDDCYRTHHKKYMIGILSIRILLEPKIVLILLETPCLYVSIYNPKK